MTRLILGMFMEAPIRSWSCVLFFELLKRYYYC